MIDLWTGFVIGSLSVLALVCLWVGRCRMEHEEEK